MHAMATSMLAPVALQRTAVGTRPSRSETRCIRSATAAMPIGPASMIKFTVMGRSSSLSLKNTGKNLTVIPLPTKPRVSDKATSGATWSTVNRQPHMRHEATRSSSCTEPTRAESRGGAAANSSPWPCRLGDECSRCSGGSGESCGGGGSCGGGASAAAWGKAGDAARRLCRPSDASPREFLSRKKNKQTAGGIAKPTPTSRITVSSWRSHWLCVMKQKMDTRGPTTLPSVRREERHT
mmetsp:Transcript_28438/g.70667  ORF Transcript_28438/g.70667 Transcript_28438/m.70667 type:complete len:238 (+) Transcript_28438:682-1395(+)